MKNFTFKRFNLVVGLVIAFACFFLLGLNSIIQPIYAQEQTFSIKSFPQRNIEINELSAPIDAIMYDDVTAIIDGNKRLSIYTPTNNKFVHITCTSLQQVKRLSDTTLVFTDQGFINTININNLSAPAENSGLGGTFFDLNDKYFIVSHSTEVRIYNITNGVISTNSHFSFKITQQTPVAINANNELFFIPEKTGEYYQIQKVTLPYTDFETAQRTVVATNVYAKPTSLCANEENLFYIDGSSVFSVNLKTNAKNHLTLNPEESFDLGNLVSPTSLFIKGENLLISDMNIGAVQEFAIDGNTLTFTGFAIAKGKTAFNRIDNTAFDVERNKDLLAVLSSDRLMIIKNDDEYDYYSRDSYVNLFEDDFGGNTPTKFALGENQALISTNDTFSLLTLDSKAENGTHTLSDIFIVEDGKIADTCYQNGKYYVLINYDTLKSKVFKFSAEDISSKNFNIENFACSSDEYTKNYSDNPQTTLGVNVFGDIIAFNDQTTKITSDLVGNFYFLKNNRVYKKSISSGATVEETSIADITSFEIDFDKKACYVLKAGQESLYPTLSLSNQAIDNVAIPKDFKITSNTTDGNLEVYLAQGGNVYVVQTQDGNFKFNELESEQEKYIFLSNLPEIDMKVLACSKGIVLASNKNLTKIELTENVAIETAYVSTDVCAYYLPIITIENTFTLSTDEQESIRLSKGTRLNTLSTIEFLDIEYYLATFTVRGVQYKGFVPVNFTTTNPISISKYSTYVFSDSKEATVYENQNLTSAIGKLQDGDVIKVFETVNGVAKIQYLSNDVWVDGYIDAKLIKKPTKTTKNVIIILVTLTCSLGTLTYFLVRKKRR